MDGHVSVLFTAELGTLAIVVAGDFSAEPSVAHEARNGILLHAESRHHPGVDDVVGGGDDADFLALRHDQGVIDLQEVVGGARVRMAGIGHFALGLVQGGIEGNARTLAAKVFITPLPLHARGFDGEVSGAGVFHGHHDLGGRPGHGDDDQEGNDGPDDFNRGAFVEIGRLRALGFAVPEDGVKHHPEDPQENQ